MCSPRVVFLCGEPATGADLELFRDHCVEGCQLVNCFGTTETATVTVRFFDHRTPPHPGILPAGFPVEDIEVVLKDDDGRFFTGAGEGEIVVRSRYLAHGYAGDATLTAKAFQSGGNESGVRLYHTGDAGLRGADGELIVTGRRVWQVSIGDQTIEFAAIEAALRALPEIHDAALTARTDGQGQDQLVAYLVPNAKLAPPPATLQARLRQVLPPAVAVHLEILDSLPRTASGKLDRTALPPPRKRRSLSAPFQPPTSGLEVEIAHVFSEVLELDEIGLHDCFFELGGKSLGALRILSRLAGCYGLQLRLGEFFGAPTVAEVASLVGLQQTYGVSPALLDDLVSEVERLSGHEASALLSGNPIQ